MGFGSSKQSSQDSSQQTSSTVNQAYPFLQSSLGGQVSNVGAGSSAISNLLGLNGAAGQTSAFDNFRNSSGYNFVKDEGIKGITGSNAARGLLGSGSALKGIAQYSSGLASNFLNSYLANLTGLSNTGLQAGQVLAGAGGTTTSQGTSSGTSSGKSTDFKLG